MFEKNLEIAYLLDFYGDVLDEHARNIMTAYYEDDLSLSEIALDAGISRQGVRHIIKKSEGELLSLESKLGLAKRNTLLQNTAMRLIEIKDALMLSDLENKEDYAKEINDAAQTILAKGV